MKYPLLAKYPALHHVLRNDPNANKDFNEVLNEVANPDTVKLLVLEKEKNEALEQITKLSKEIADLKKAGSVMSRFVILLGETIEEQVSLNRYTQDVIDNVSYTIKFSAKKIRMALKLHWDAIAVSMETGLRNRHDNEE